VKFTKQTATSSNRRFAARTKARQMSRYHPRYWRASDGLWYGEGIPGAWETRTKLLAAFHVFAIERGERPPTPRRIDGYTQHPRYWR